MNDILLTNIFFAITAIATVTLTIIVIVLLAYLIKLVRKIGKLTDMVTEEAERVIEDVEAMRETVHEGAAMAKNLAIAKIFRFFSSMVFGGKNKK